MVNTLNWFEIPAIDFARAKTFYATVLDAQIHEDPNMQYAYLVIP
ncbi:VOC family protein [Chryseobacterium binzhouense]